MKLYLHPMSGNSWRALLVVNHLAVPLERVVVDLSRGEQRGETHLGRNPNGRLPVLEDDGFMLWESRAIMQYLAEKTPGQTLLPLDARGRADVSRWLFWCTAHMAQAHTLLVYENFVKAMMGGRPDPAEVTRGEVLFARYAPVLDAHLAGREWVAQERLTLADFSLAVSFSLEGPARLPLKDYANIQAWLGRVQQLEAWKNSVPPMPPAARG